MPRGASPVRSTTPRSCSPTSSAPPADSFPLVDPVDRRSASGVRRPRRPSRRPRAAPAPHRDGRLPPRRAARRPRRLRAAARDRAARRLGDRPCPGGGPADGPAAGRGRPVHRLGRDRAQRRATRCADAEVHAVELDPAAFGWAERNLAGTRGRPASRRHGRGLPRPGRHRRRGGVQPAVHPARGLRERGPRGARPRPGARAVVRRRRPRRHARPGGDRRRGCCGPAGWVGASTPTCRGSPRPGSSWTAAVGPTCATTGTWQVVRAT